MQTKSFSGILCVLRGFSNKAGVKSGYECHWAFGTLLFPYPHVYIIPEYLQRPHIHISSHDPKAAPAGGQGSNYCSEERQLLERPSHCGCQEMVGPRLKPRALSPSPVSVPLYCIAPLFWDQNSAFWCLGATEMIISELLLMRCKVNLRENGTGSKNTSDKNIR